MRARPLKASGSASLCYMGLYLLFGPSLYLFSPWWRYRRFRLTCYHRVSVSARSVSPTATRGKLRRISRGVLPWLAVSARSVSPLATRVRLRARHLSINGYRKHLFPYLLFGPSLYLFSPWWRYSRFRLTCYHRVSVSARSVSPLATRVRLRARHRLRLCFQDSACINR